MQLLKSIGAVSAMILGLGAGASNAGTVTPDIIFGSGNANGSFTISTIKIPRGDIEIGLRAKLRYNDAGDPENTFNWDGTDTYNIGGRTVGTPANRSVFNFEWSINSEDTGLALSHFISSGASVQISFDTDPSAATTFVAYDPFAFDAWYGTNSTPNGGGAVAVGAPLAGATVAQNSVNYGFIPGAPVGNGIYDVKLSVFNMGGTEIGSTQITISAVPIPAAGLLLLTAFGGLGLVAHRRRTAA